MYLGAVSHGVCMQVRADGRPGTDRQRQTDRQTRMRTPLYTHVCETQRARENKWRGRSVVCCERDARLRAQHSTRGGPAARSMADTKASTVAGISWLCGKYADTRHCCSELVSRGVSGERSPTSPQPQPIELQCPCMSSHAASSICRDRTDHTGACACARATRARRVSCARRAPRARLRTPLGERRNVSYHHAHCPHFHQKLGQHL